LKESQTNKIWSDREIKREQLRATLAIATIAACYYAGSLPLLVQSARALLTVLGGLLVVFWAPYFGLMSFSIVYDINLEQNHRFLEFIFSERICRSLRELGNISFILGSFLAICLTVAVVALILLGAAVSFLGL
jgi:hypothetical protein